MTFRQSILWPRNLVKGIAGSVMVCSIELEEQHNSSPDIEALLA
jgi:hypothetical protein